MTDSFGSGVIYGVVVTFEPNVERFRQVLQAAAPQLAGLVVVDNSESVQGRADSAACCDEVATAHAQVAVRFADMGTNLGLSQAFNRGIALAGEQGASHVLLLDQDSIVGSGMIAALLRGLTPDAATLQALGRDRPPITVGPWYVDELSGRRSVVLRSKTLMVGYIPTPVEPKLRMPTEMLISSGSLVPVSAFAELGPLDAELFIDHVDTDWALRAHQAGHWLAIIPDANMTHRLGDRVLRLWWGRVRLLPVHSPIRLYYTFRNSLWLYVRPQGHWRWVLFDLRRLLAVTAIHLLAAGPRWPRLQMIFRGIRDGLLGWRNPR